MHVGTMVQVNSTGMLFARLRTRLLLPLVAAALLGTVASASSQQLADPRVAERVLERGLVELRVPPRPWVAPHVDQRRDARGRQEADQLLERSRSVTDGVD